MTTGNTALIVGATGLSGSYTAKHLKEHGWTVVTVSRSDVDLPGRIAISPPTSRMGRRARPR